MSEKQVQGGYDQSTDDEPDNGVDRSTSPSAASTDGVYIDESDYVAQQSLSEPSSDRSLKYAELVGLERSSDTFIASLELPTGRRETFEFEMESNSHLPHDLRLLYHYLNIETHNPAQLRGELVPVKVTETGVTLELGVTPPPSNRNPSNEGSPTLPGLWGTAQLYSGQLRLLQSTIGLLALGLLLLPLLILSSVSSLGSTNTAVLFALSIASLVLFIKPYLD